MYFSYYFLLPFRLWHEKCAYDINYTEIPLIICLPYLFKSLTVAIREFKNNIKFYVATTTFIIVGVILSLFNEGFISSLPEVRRFLPLILCPIITVIISRDIEESYIKNYFIALCTLTATSQLLMSIGENHFFLGLYCINDFFIFCELKGLKAVPIFLSNIILLSNLIKQKTKTSIFIYVLSLLAVISFFSKGLFICTSISTFFLLQKKSKHILKIQNMSLVIPFIYIGLLISNFISIDMTRSEELINNLKLISDFPLGYGFGKLIAYNGKSLIYTHNFFTYILVKCGVLFFTISIVYFSSFYVKSFYKENFLLRSIIITFYIYYQFNTDYLLTLPTLTISFTTLLSKKSFLNV